MQQRQFVIVNLLIINLYIYIPKLRNIIIFNRKT